MKVTKLYSGEDGKSYFADIEIEHATQRRLGAYSKAYSVKDLYFRDSVAGGEAPWHDDPQPQYIVYLEGKVEIEASGGEKRLFLPGDILLVTDMTGKGHITRVLTPSRALIITL